MASSTKKVGGKNKKATTAVAATEPETSKGGPGMTRDPFDFSTAIDGDDNPCVVDDANSEEHGLLTEFPANYELGKHTALSKADFAKEHGWWDYKAASAQRAIDQYSKALTGYLEKADTCRKFGNEADRKRVLKLQSMRDEYARIMQECQDDGIEVPEELLELVQPAG